AAGRQRRSIALKVRRKLPTNGRTHKTSGAFMEFLTRSASVRDRIRIWRAAGARVALVPTAGTLHKGHMSLVAEAQERADHVIVSLFADPRGREAPTLEADRELLQKMGATLAFAPPLQEIYPTGLESAARADVPSLADVLEG